MWYPVKTPKFVKWLYPGLLWNYPAQEKAVLYLTFDDGPTPKITPFVLDLLAKYNAKATFFCIGRNAETHPDILQRIINEGHSIGNHTYNHLNGWKTKLSDYLENTEKCNVILKTKLFRPPYGRLKPAQQSAIRRLGYKIVMWDVIAGDFDQQLDKEKCLHQILQFSKNGTILVLHDSKKSFPCLEYVLPLVLEHFGSLGYEFKKIEQNP